MPTMALVIRTMARVALVLFAALSACAPLPPAQKIREKLRLPPPPADAALYAGLDLLEHVPQKLRERPQYADSVRFDPEVGVLVRTLSWRVYGDEITFVCAVGQRDAAGPSAMLPELVAGLGFVADELAPGDGLGHASVVHARDPDALVAWSRGNVSMAIRQAGHPLFVLRDVAETLDAKTQAQPPLGEDAFPRLREVKCPNNLERVKLGTHVQFILQPEGETGFLWTGWKINELGRSFAAWLHVDRMIQAIYATRPGAFSITLWVANRRQLATCSSARFTVVE